MRELADKVVNMRSVMHMVSKKVIMRRIHLGVTTVVVDLAVAQVACLFALFWEYLGVL